MGIAMPGPDRLPPGHHRDLVEALHRLYRGAGKPGLRRIAKAIMEGDFRDTVSHEKIATMLRGAGLPSWTKLEPVVRVLAHWNTARLDADAVSARIQHLWHRAQTTDTGVAAHEDHGAVSREPGGESGSHEPSDGVDAEALVRVVSADVAARARDERQAESDRGYLGGVEFAGELPTWRQLEELADAGFRVGQWITPQREQWSLIAAGHAPERAEIPAWAWKAARWLGALADPIGYDEFSFTPTDTYLDAFGAGLRAVWEAAQPAATAGPGVTGRELGTSLGEGERADGTETSVPGSRPPAHTDWQSELDSSVGMAPFKEVVDDLVLLEWMRRVHGGGLPLPQYVFVGPPGTGKTRAARIMGSVLRDLGLLRRGHVVEVSRTDFVGEYLGHAAEQVQEAMRSAQDGVLYIDGALNLAEPPEGFSGWTSWRPW
jgi:hypothetical protein